MKARKTLLIIFGIFLLLLMLGVGAGRYVYTHPPVVKSLMERVVSGATGIVFSMEHLSYSLNPIRVHGQGIVFESSKKQIVFSTEIKDITADCALQGPFGQRRLVFKSLAINGLKCRVREGAAIPPVGSGSEKPSFLKSVAGSLVSFFLFKDITLEAAHMGEGVVTASLGGREITVSHLSGHLHGDRLIHLQGGLLLTSEAGQAALSIPDFHVDTTGTLSLRNPRMDFTVAFSDGTFSTPQAKIGNMQGETSLRYDPSKGEILFDGLDLTLQGTRLPQMGATPLGITLNAGGRIDLKGQAVEVRGLSLDVKELLRVDGKLDATFGGRPRFKLFLDEGRIFSRKLWTLPPIGGNLAAFTISGPIDFSGTFSGEIERDEWAFFSDMKGNLKKNSVSYRTHDMHLKGFMGGEFAVQGPLSHLDLSGELTGERMSVHGNGLSTESATGTIRFSGVYPEFELAKVSCRIPHSEFILKEKTLSVAHIEMDATKGRINLLEPSFHFSEIRAKSSLLNNILASVQMDDGRLTLRAQGKETGWLHAASALKLLPPHWTFRGTDTLKVSATVDQTRATTFTAKLAIEKFHFRNPQETGLGENISLRARISGQMKSDPSMVEATAEITADQGEVLMDRFYFDLRKNAFFVRFDGDYRGDHDRLKVNGLSLGLKAVATARVTGELFQTGDEYEGKFSIQIPETSLKEPFERLVREPFQTENPSLQALRVDGIIGAEMTLAGKPSRWVGKGVCKWKDGALRYGDSNLDLAGIRLSLPLWLTNATDEKKTETLKGGLTVLSMRVPFLPEQELKVPLEAAQNRLLMPAATTLMVPGGAVHIGPSRVTPLMGEAPALHTALYFENLQLAPALSGLWPYPVTGHAHGHLDSIRIQGGKLQSTGKITADIFGGTLTLSRVGARGLFTTLPVVHLDAQWHHLNLARMTEGTPFGKIEGILDGHAKDLEVSNGQLQRFDLILDTVETDDVPQRISVKAVDNIARLGGGQSPFMGVAGMFVSLFKEFPYEKIGVHATLENDIFKIHGTIREDGKEYLVKRGFFSGVDVINQNRDNQVGFNDMLKRIKRITDSKGGPVIR